MLWVGIDVIILGDVRHDSITDEIGEGAASLFRQVVRLDVCGLVLHVDLAQIGNQLIHPVDVVVRDRDNDRLVVGDLHHACNVLADVPARHIVIHPSVLAGSQNALTVKHIDDGVFLGRFFIIVIGSQDINVLVATVKLKYLCFELRIIDRHFADRIGQQHIVLDVPAADEAVEGYVHAVFSVARQMYHVVLVDVRLATVDAAAVILFGDGHIHLSFFTGAGIQEGSGQLAVGFGRSDDQLMKELLFRIGGACCWFSVVGTGGKYHRDHCNS